MPFWDLVVPGCTLKQVEEISNLFYIKQSMAQIKRRLGHLWWNFTKLFTNIFFCFIYTKYTQIIQYLSRKFMTMV